MSTELADKSRRFLQNKPIHQRWESDYLNPDMNAFYDLAFADIVARIGATPKTMILDAGCGYCYHTTRLARSGARITAVDFSDAALAAARVTIEEAGLQDQVTLRQADLTALPFPDGTFDSVVTWGVLMHIPQLELALSELARVLKPGGTLVVCENNMHSLDVRIRERAIRLAKKALGRGQPEMEITPRGIENWTRTDSGGLMVRKTDMNFLDRFMAARGLDLATRTAGQFTEAYTNLPLKPLKRLVYAFNVFYFRRQLSPALAMGNIVYFRKR